MNTLCTVSRLPRARDPETKARDHARSDEFWSPQRDLDAPNMEGAGLHYDHPSKAKPCLCFKVLRSIQTGRPM